MNSVLAGKSKTELGLEDNKAIAINSLVGIEIEKFRSLADQSLVLGERISRRFQDGGHQVLEFGGCCRRKEDADWQM